MTYIDISQWRGLLYTNHFRFEDLWYMVDSIEQDEVLSEYVAHHNPMLWNILSGSPLSIDGSLSGSPPSYSRDTFSIYASSMKALCLFFCSPVNEKTEAYCSENKVLSMPFSKGDILIYEGVFALKTFDHVLFVKPTNQKIPFLDYPGAVKYKEEDFIYQYTAFIDRNWDGNNHTFTYKGLKYLIKFPPWAGLKPVYG